jgi:hypothetical protein
LAAFLGTPVPLTSRQEEDRYWCDSVAPGIRGFAGNASVYGLDRFGGDEAEVDVGWSCSNLRSGH